MKRVFVLFMLACLPVLATAQETFKVNGNYEKLMVGTIAYDLDFNDDYSFMVTDLAPGSGGSPPVAFLVFDKKANALTKVKFSFNHKKDEVIGSVALGDKITLFYSGKSKTTKKLGLHAQTHNAKGELLTSASFFETDGKESAHFLINSSANKKFMVVSDGKKVLLLDQDLKIIHEKIILSPGFQDVMVTNGGSIIVENSTGGKLSALLYSPQGEKVKEAAYEFAANNYTFNSMIDETSNKLYVASLANDGGKKAITVNTRLQALDLKSFSSILVADQAVNSGSIKLYNFPDIFCFGEDVYIISQEIYNDSKEVIAPKNARERHNKIKNYTKLVADKMNISLFKSGKAVANNIIVRHVATDGNFMWMLEPHMFIVNDKPTLAYYSLGNVSVGSYNYKLRTANLDDSLEQVDMKETDTGDMELNINHTQPMPSGTDKFYFVGWKSLQKFGSAELTF